MMNNLWRHAWICGLAIAINGSALASSAPATEPPKDAVASTKKAKPILRVAADPNNLPFTNDRREGFENKIAELIAAELGADLQYIWRAQRRGFFRQALKEGECDLILGVPAGFEMALTTAPYYRSTYVFVSRSKETLGITSFDDAALRELKIGVQMIGDDGANTPPAHALAARGIIKNVTGYTVYGDYRQPNPPARILQAVASGDVEIAVVWGPTAGYFATKQSQPLDLKPVQPAVDSSGLPFTFAIAMGVRKGDQKLRDLINEILIRRKADIDRILDQYHVPRVAPAVAGPRP